MINLFDKLRLGSLRVRKRHESLNRRCRAAAAFWEELFQGNNKVDPEYLRDNLLRTYVEICMIFNVYGTPAVALVDYMIFPKNPFLRNHFSKWRGNYITDENLEAKINGLVMNATFESNVMTRFATVD